MTDIKTEIEHMLSRVAAFVAYEYPTDSNVVVNIMADPDLLLDFGEIHEILVIHDGAAHTSGDINGLAEVCLLEEGYFLSSFDHDPDLILSGAAHDLSQADRIAALARYCMWSDAA